ncbi:hypothetical protein, partial [Burkholderia cenocepacia]|uniref:hypothetical protein n=1 Tax=Burkholderia cenocepacia TaxID=95486 RepID=UPI0015C56679
VKKSGSHVEQSWKLLEESKRLLEFDTTTEKNDAVANMFLKDGNSLMEKAIFCCTNEEIKANNELVQEKRLSAGEIGGNN